MVVYLISPRYFIYTDKFFWQTKVLYQVPSTKYKVQSMDSKSGQTTTRLSSVDCGLLKIVPSTKYPPRRAGKYKVWMLNLITQRHGCRQSTVDRWQKLSTADGRQTTGGCTKYHVPTTAGRHVQSMDSKSGQTTTRLSTVDRWLNSPSKVLITKFLAYF
jgi:hypothetical protein